MATNTGKKDIKGRIIYSGPRGRLYVVTQSGKKSKPAAGRVSRKELEQKARNLSAKRIVLEQKAKNLSARREQIEAGAKFLNNEAHRMNAQSTLGRIDNIVAKKANNVKIATKNLYTT